MRTRFGRTEALTVVVALALGTLPSHDAAAQAVVPTQWIAKQHTEVYGRAPSPTEWNSWVSYYQSAGCSATTLANKSKELLFGFEFASRYSETTQQKGARIIALLRAAFNHEPNTSDWSGYYTPYANNTKTWVQTVDAIYASFGFLAWVAPAVCNPANPSYGFTLSGVMDVQNLTGGGASRSWSTLQSQLDAAASTCGTVSLGQTEVVGIGGTLRVPPCVTLTTSGSPLPTSYARMGRIVGNNWLCLFAASAGGVAVKLGAGATLKNVWIDTRAVGSNCRLASVQIDASTATSPTLVVDNRITDPPPGGIGIKLRGFGTTGQACSGAAASRNLITGYARSHARDRMTQAMWADGILDYCENATIEQNEIVDVGDWGIGIFGVRHRGLQQGAVQQSQVRLNKVLSAGVSGTVALGADPTGECLAMNDGPVVMCNDMPVERSFVGSRVENNTFWTGPRTALDVGLLVGGFTVWGENGPLGRGATFTGNTTGAASARVNVGIAVSGMYDTTLTGNTGAGGVVPGSYVLVDSIGEATGDYAGCDVLQVGDTRPYLASFTAGSQTSVPNASLWSCLLPPPPTGGLDKIVPSGEIFVGRDTGLRFDMWGANYTSPGPDVLMEDAWVNETNYKTLIADFRELKQGGVNVVRIPLQTRKYMTGPTTFDDANFARLLRLVDVAGKLGIRIGLMGLASYFNTLEPLWYTNVTETERWDIQARFWTEVATRVSNRPEIAFYELMNEPTAAQIPSGDPPYTGDDWCPNTFAGYCFAPAITLTRDNRTNGEIMHPWAVRMHDAIRSVDAWTPVSIGNNGGFPYPGSGIGPTELGDVLDFMTSHLYPADDDRTAEDEVVTQDLPLVRAMKQPGKPLIIGETSYYLDFSNPPHLFCDNACLERFIFGSRPDVVGWFTFLGGATELQREADPNDNILLEALANESHRLIPWITPCLDCQQY